MPIFIPGLELCRHFYHEAVRPILDEYFPNLRHSAGLLGSGSEILGYDTEMSTDHHWGPRVMLFLMEADFAQHSKAIRRTLSQHLSPTFMGYSTHYGEPMVGDHGTQLLKEAKVGQLINHRVELFTISDFVWRVARIQLDEPMPPSDWLSLDEQVLLELSKGAVYHDDLGLQAIRERFAYFPHDVWLYLLIGGWSRLSQDDHLASRAGFVGDKLGSAVIAGRMVRSIMHLWFLMHHQYAPYPKWFGTAFGQLPQADELTPILRRMQTGETWQDREKAYGEAYAILIHQHNTLNLTDPIEPQLSQFHNRPFIVSHAHRLVEQLQAQITDPDVQRITQRRHIGSLRQFSDNTDLREAVDMRHIIKELYDGDA